MRYRIEKGDRFKCIRTFGMEDGEVAYSRGKEYLSEVSSNITDNQHDTYHNMDSTEDFFKHFKLIS